MKVAFATTRGSSVDEHFGRAGRFAVYDVRETGAEFVELRQVAEGDIDVDVVTTRGLGTAHDDAVSAKIERLADVRIIYFTEIGGPSAAKLVQRGIMPVKTAEGSSVAATLEELVATINTRPAPWIRKALAADEPKAGSSAGNCGCGGTSPDPS